MARHETDITIDTGRDAGKVYRLKEMPAFQAESWTHRVGVCLAHAGVDILTLVGLDPKNPDEGRAAIVMLFDSLRGINYHEAKPLLDEMISCVMIVPSGGVPRALTGQDDVEDLGTINKIRAGVFNLHLDFWQSAIPSKGLISGLAQQSS